MSAIKQLLDGRIVVASVSGGKDSAALSLWLTEQGIEHRRVFADTGWEHRSTYDYLRGPLTKALGPIDEVGHPGGMKALITKKAMFPSRLRRFCTEDLKVRPLSAYVRHIQDTEGECVSAVGIRAAESRARAEMEEWEWSAAFDCETWRPLLRWTEQDVIDIHKRHGLVPNPLYLKGAQRVGCFPCIFARKTEIKLVAEIAPERIEEIRVLERETSEAAKKRAHQGQFSQEHGYERTFFAGKLTRDMRPMPIDTIVEWSRTGAGGKQYELIEEPAPEGCVRWGLCEVAR